MQKTQSEMTIRGWKGTRRGDREAVIMIQARNDPKTTAAAGMVPTGGLITYGRQEAWATTYVALLSHLVQLGAQSKH